MIGQSLINVSSGARARLSGIVAAVMLLVFILFGAPLIEQLPMAALTGLMIMVAIGTFEWASLRTFRRMPTSDVLIMLVVTIVTAVQHNLALVQKCISEGVQLDFFPYPMHPHNVRGKDRVHLMTKILNYVIENNK